MDILNRIASILVLLNGIVGIVFNIFVIYVYFNGSQEKNSFNLICLTRAINNIIVLVFNFLLLSFPVIFLSSNIYPDIIETVIITSTINVYLVNQLQTVAIALNRFIALYIPLRYKTLCSNQVTWVVLGLLYAQRGYETFSELYDLISNDCKIHMDSNTFYTAYYDKNCSKKVPVDSDLIVLMPSIFLAITIVLNLATFAKILRFYFFNSMNSESTSLAMKNIRLFFQTVFQDALFLIDATFTFKLSALSDSRIWTFISTVFVWESIHTLDGLIMLLFSDRLSILRTRFTRISSNQVSSTSGNGGLNGRGGRASSSLPGVA